MSDYHTYLKNGDLNIEINIPNIYKSDDSETNCDQIRTYLANLIGINYDYLIVDIIRKKRKIKKCDIPIENGDELYFYINKEIKIDLSELEIKSGFYCSIDKSTTEIEYTEKHLDSIKLRESIYTEKIYEIINLNLNLINSNINPDSKIILMNLIPMKFNLSYVSYYKLNFIEEENYFFGNLDENGIPNGYGFYFNKLKGEYYEGYFKNNSLTNGKCISFRNSSYIIINSLFIDRLASGYGSMNYFNGSEKYEGFFKNGLYSDNGKLTNLLGEYSGDFNEGYYNGYGKMIYSNNDVYTGFWNFGVKSIFGKYKYYNGNYYIGCWNNDKKEEFGISYDITKHLNYIGTFKDNIPTYNLNEFIELEKINYYTDFIGFEESKLKIEEKIMSRLNINIYDQDKVMFRRNLYNSYDSLEEIKDLTEFFYVGNYDFQFEKCGMGILYFNKTNGIIDNYINNEVSKYPYSKLYIDIKYKGFQKYYFIFDNLNKENNFGMIRYEDNSFYIGYTKNFYKNGFGILNDGNGNIISGNWQNGILI
jgi:hypothetical protein